MSTTQQSNLKTLLIVISSLFTEQVEQCERTINVMHRETRRWIGARVVPLAFQ